MIGLVIEWPVRCYLWASKSAAGEIFSGAEGSNKLAFRSRFGRVVSQFDKNFDWETIGKGGALRRSSGCMASPLIHGVAHTV